MSKILIDHRINKSSIDYRFLNDIFYIDCLRDVQSNVDENLIYRHYTRTAVLREWDTIEGNDLKNNLSEKVIRFNEKAIEHEMYISTYTDWDLNLASYSFGFKSKPQN